MVADFPICALSVLRYGDQGLVTLSEPLTIEPIGIAAPPGDVLLVNYLENAMDALETSGFMSTVRARWLERSDWVQELP
jgi:polar amino acid transport system substrate-binding protein